LAGLSHISFSASSIDVYISQGFTAIAINERVTWFKAFVTSIKACATFLSYEETLFMSTTSLRSMLIYISYDYVYIVDCEVFSIEDSVVETVEIE
jgi:hypothetical protein